MFWLMFCSAGSEKIEKKDHFRSPSSKDNGKWESFQLQLPPSKPKAKQRMVFRMTHVKDSLLLRVTKNTCIP